jgi:KDO2-lipid IV(A) lauroyltransferase
MGHSIEFLAFSLFRGFLHLIPFGLVQRTGRCLGRAGYYLLRSRRGITLDNLRHAFPGTGEPELNRIALGAFENFGIAMSEFLCFSRLAPDDLRRLMNFEANSSHFGRLAGRKGLLFLSGHFGNWELTGAGSSCLGGVEYLVIVKRQSNTMVDRVVEGLRCRFGNRVVPMEKAVRETMKRLAEGGAVALAPDQSASKESEFVSFFGREVATFRGPAAFALRAGVPMMMGFTVRRDDYTYDFILEEVKSDDLDGATEANILELTRRHVRLLEDHIRRHPDHWLWMHRRWKHVTVPDASTGGGRAGA